MVLRPSLSRSGRVWDILPMAGQALLDQRHALDSCRLFTAGSVEEIEARIAEVMQPHSLRPLGEGAGSSRSGFMNYLNFADIGIGTINFGAMSLEVEQDDFHLMIFCLRGNAQVRIGQNEVELSRMLGLCVSPGDRLSARFSEDCEQLVVRLDGQMVRRFCGGNARLRTVFQGADVSAAPWRHAVGAMISDPATINLVRSNPAVAASYASVFMSTLDSSGIWSNRNSLRDAQPACIKRAEDYIRAFYAEPLTLDMIARVARVSPRSLLQNFRSFSGTSPIRLLRDVRLDAAREALVRRRDDPDATVLSVALDAGFNHLGRFSQAYAARFGEKPSETLRKPASSTAAWRSQVQ
jgi:AraC-like DNA-binding protein